MFKKFVFILFFYREKNEFNMNYAENVKTVGWSNLHVCTQMYIKG